MGLICSLTHASTVCYKKSFCRPIQSFKVLLTWNNTNTIRFHEILMDAFKQWHASSSISLCLNYAVHYWALVTDQSTISDQSLAWRAVIFIRAVRTVGMSITPQSIVDAYSVATTKLGRIASAARWYTQTIHYHAKRKPTCDYLLVSNTNLYHISSFPSYCRLLIHVNLRFRQVYR